MCAEKRECERPQDLKSKPQECSPEQIRECHGEANGHPCAPSAGCQNPDELEGKPGGCSPEHVKRCHGDVQTHPCTKKTE